MIDYIKKLMDPLSRRIYMMIARGIIKSTDDSTTIQKLQVALLADEVIDGLHRVQEYGFSSAPLPGAEAIALFVGGNRDHGVIIATDDRRYRKKDLENGEVALYTDEGDYIYFKRNGEIEIQSSSKVSIASPLVEISGDLTVSGTITGATVQEGSTSIGDIKSAFNGHTHGETGGVTSGPSPTIP